MKKVFMILGAKYEQIPLMLKASEMGYKTVAVDFNEHPAGADHCDYFYNVSYSDDASVVAIAKKHDVAGIGTMGTNSAIAIAGKVSNQLRLPGLYDTPKVLERALNKDLWRPVLERKGVPIAKGRVCRSLLEAQQAVSIVGYPALFKPSDASGSKGITIAGSPDEDIREHFYEAMSYSLSKNVIVEEYLGHNSFEVESFVVDGTIHFVTTGERKLPPPPICVGLGCTVPDSLSLELRNRIREVNRAAITALGITYGPVHLDMVFDVDGIPHVIDVGPRLVAGPIAWQHIPKTTGVDMVEAVALQAVGEKANINPKATGLYSATRHITSDDDGILDHLNTAEDSFVEHNIVSFQFFPKKGDKISRLRHGEHRYGFVTAWDDSYEGVCQKIDSFMDKLSFCFRDGSGNEKTMTSIDERDRQENEKAPKSPFLDRQSRGYGY